MDDVRLIQLPRIPDYRGNLSVIEQGREVPFDISRAYWIYDVPGGESRCGHAYRQNCELIVALSGSLDVVVMDGRLEPRTIHLNRSYRGLYVPAGIWRELQEFSTNAVALVLASTPYDPNDYIETVDDYREYISMSGRGE